MAAASESNQINVFEYEYLAPKIIAEVKKRPLLYDTTQRKRKDKIKKAKLWNKVYSALFSNWRTLSDIDQKKRADLVQKKWKNIRDCFFKELTMLQTKKHQKKKYIHFDSLLFLLPNSKKKEESSKDKNQSSYVQDNIDTSSDSFSSQNIEEPNTSVQIPSQSDDSQQMLDNRDFEKDVAFSEMIVPKLRNLNDQQKHYAKIEIMTILHKARYYPV